MRKGKVVWRDMQGKAANPSVWKETNNMVHECIVSAVRPRRKQIGDFSQHGSIEQEADIRSERKRQVQGIEKLLGASDQIVEASLS